MSFEVDGATYTLPELDTRTWLDTLPLAPPGCWWNLIPLQLAPPDAERLLGRLASNHDDFDLDDLEHDAIAVLGAVCGMDFWAATRLADLVRDNWLLFDGHATTIGFRPLAEPIDRVLAAAYTWRRAMCGRKSELTRLDAEIWAPGPEATTAGTPRQPEPAGWDDDHEAAVFEQAIQQAGGARGGA